MKFELVELDDYSGSECAMYSILVEDDEHTLLDHFVDENSVDFKNEVDDILNRLEDIADTYGAREYFFKLKEGAPGDGVCALYDDPDSNLRLYGIRFSSAVIVLGGGGYKPKRIGSKVIRSLQEIPKLKKENYLLRDVSKCITKALLEKTLTFNGYKFDGDFTFDTDDL